ncbi:GerAB/ArcD/ProY family transporter [Priestia megaterium]|uniref:GerAB/ArcD/ProY family transporter n=1 Tax=Priestia megaterium TaxID=1404 RepID=UPI0025A3D204|nr:endospore germination permease [Priestia megaterium]MDM8150084.1 endospore germination permease [Priestia megaterium]
MERISAFQLFTLTIFLQIGTTVIFGFASPAGRDAWLAILISTILGMLVILLHTYLMELNPGLTLVEWFPAQLGRWLGMPLAWLYPLLFLYCIGRIFSDLKALIPATILPGTPPWFVVVTILIVIIYCVFSGIEVLARFTEYLLPVLFLLLAIEVILLFSSGLVDLKNMLPILGQGGGKVWRTVWPTDITQTFAETLTLAMIWPLVKSPEKIRKITIVATIVSGLTIALFSFMEVSVLGEDIVQRTVYPLYLLVKQITIADFLENLDALVALNMVVFAYIKVTIYFFAAVRSIQLLLNMNDGRSLIFPVALVTYFFGMTMSRNINEHLYIAIKIFPLYLWMPLVIILPIVLLIVTLIRKKWSNWQNKHLQKG